MTFCSRCGSSTTRSTCEGCGYQTFVNPRPTGGLIVMDDAGRVLLLRRARPPKAGMWELPGGFCDGWEEPAQTAVREGREELGVDVALGPFAGMYVGSYEFQGEVFPVLDCFWLASLPPDTDIVLDPAESTEAGWFALSDPPQLAFSTMTRAVQNAALLLTTAMVQEDHRTKGQLAQ